MLITKNRQTFLQAQLKPIPTGNPVARPIVEIFMGYDRFDVGIVIVSSSFGIGQNVLRVEHIETFVLHGSHVEIVDSDDVEQI